MNKNLNFSFKTQEGEPTELAIVDTEQGWVEYLGTLGLNVYYIDNLDRERFNIFANDTKAALAKKVFSTDKDENAVWLGFVNSLAKVRMDSRWIMPYFLAGTSIDDLQITCGNSRFAADLMMRTPPNEMRFVAIAPDLGGQYYAKKLETSAEFDALFKLKGTDYKLNFGVRNDQIECLGSVLRYSVWDFNDPTVIHTAVDNQIKSLWLSSLDAKGEKVKIQISCTEETRKFVNFGPMFEVDWFHQKPEEWQFSFGRILGQYKDDNAPRSNRNTSMQLWLYDITEPLDLELLIPWVDGSTSCYYTQNEKSVLFHTRNVGELKIIGNWVK